MTNQELILITKRNAEIKQIFERLDALEMKVNELEKNNCDCSKIKIKK